MALGVAAPAQQQQPQHRRLPPHSPLPQPPLQQRQLLADGPSAWGWSLTSLTSGWPANPEFDRLYFPLACVLWAASCLKRAALLTPPENLQNLVLLLIVSVPIWLSLLSPRLYRRYTPLVRLGMIIYGYSMPVLNSLRVMQAYAPAPSTVPLVHGIVDTYSLWLATRIAFLGWAVIGARPPLYLAIPFQLFGLWRTHSANFCQSPVLRHQVMQDRTALAHFLLSLMPSWLGSNILSTLIPAGPEQCCSALLLFYSILFALVIPLLMLLPLRQRGHTPTVADRRRSSLGARLDQRIEGWLRLLTWPQARRPLEWQQGTGAADADAEAPRGARAGPDSTAVWLLNWWVLLVAIWAGCCLLEG